MNRSEVEMLEENAMQVEEKEKNQLQAFDLFDKTTLAWLTVGLLLGHLPLLLRAKTFVAGSFLRGPWTQDVVEILRGYRWNPLGR